MKDKFSIVEKIEIVHKNKDGEVLSKRTIKNSLWNRLLCKLGLKHNCLTKYGFAEVAGLMVADVGGTPFDYIAIGTGDEEATVLDEELEIEVTRKVSVGTLIEGTYPDDTAQWVATFSSADGLSGTDLICEIGVLNQDTGGILLLRQVYSPPDNCNWDAGDSLQITVKCQVQQGT